MGLETSKRGKDMKFSYSAVWEDTLGLLRAHTSLIAALAGVFLFLPSLLVAYFLPQPQPEDFSRYGELLVEYISANWHWLLLETLANMVGALAIMLLILARGGTTVGGAIAAALAILPFYFLAGILSGLIIGIGCVLLIVPGLYLLGRLLPLGPVMVAEQRRNPIDAIRRTFEVTRGNGWAVFGLLLLVAIPALIASAVANMLLGLVFRLVAGGEVGRLLSLIVTSATGAAVAALLTVLYAAIYRRLTAEPASAAAAD
jgi:hypothetical protein